MGEPLAVPVRGGVLHGEVSGPADAPVVLLAHGITANLRGWDGVVAELEAGTSAMRTVAVDLRGRGRSADLPGPSSMAGHARDLVAVLDHLGVDRAVLAGHSMGGYVACVAATNHADRFPQVVLVDGGPPLLDGPPVPDEQVEAVLLAVVGPSLQRLQMTFASRESYRAFWRAHPALAHVDARWVDRYADHDLVPDAAGGWRSAVSRERVMEDGRDLLTGDALRTAFTRLAPGTVMVRAGRGMLDEPEGLYTTGRVAEIRAAAPTLHVIEVSDVNHFTVTIDPVGIAVVVEAIRAAADATARPHGPS